MSKARWQVASNACGLKMRTKIFAQHSLELYEGALDMARVT